MSFSQYAAPSASSVSTPLTSTVQMLLSSPLSMTVVPTTTTSLSASTTLTASNSTSTFTSRPGAENGECRLLGPFALFIQGALGLLALLSLVYKRWRERPQRPVKVWAFDASKQVVGSGLLHVANLLMSMISSGEFKPKANDYQANPCSFYLLNLAIDTTLGIPVLIIALSILTYMFLRTPFGEPPESIQSGNYGRPPRAKWWLKQCFIYFIGLVSMKFCVFVIFQVCPWIIRVGDWALKWTEGDERVQVFFVMLFFPVVMNAIQYYIIDSFIKEQKPAEHEIGSSADGDEDGLSEDDNDDEGDGDRPTRGRRPRHDHGHDRNDATTADLRGDNDTILTKTDADLKAAARQDKEASLPSSEHIIREPKDPKKLDEYNPDTDGASSSSGSKRLEDESAQLQKRGG